MTRISNMVVFITLVVVATMLQSSSGQTVSPAPSPSRPPVTYTVGDSLGWLVPPGGPIAYETWARGKTFMVGDILVFNFTNGAHDVAEVSKAGFDSCNISAATNTITTSPARITLTIAGEHFYICTFPQHCSLGQKLAINVTGANSAPAQPPATPAPATTPSPVATPAPSPSRPPMTYTVGDNLGWLVPPGGPIAYETWARGKNFMVGDILVFNFTNGAHDVAEVRKAGFDSCNISTATNTITTSPARITLTTAGEHFYICTFPQHCSLGQKLAINVSGANSAPAQPPATPAPATTPSPVATPAPSPSRPPMTYTVGDNLGWLVPPGGPIAYETWARGKNFMVGDILVFNFTNGAHDVAEVRKAGFDSCNISAATNTITTSPARITLTIAGEHFYICTFPQHCSLGQKLAINVTRATSTTPSSSPAPAPSSTTTPPPSTTTPPPSSDSPTPPSIPTSPSPFTAPPPPDSAAPPSFRVAAFPFTLLSIALAFLY